MSKPHDPLNGWCDHGSDDCEPEPPETLDDALARHQERCGGRFAERYVGGGYAYRCGECGAGYQTDSSG